MSVSASIIPVPQFTLRSRPAECFPWAPLSLIEKTLTQKEAALQNIIKSFFTKEVTDDLSTFDAWKKRLKQIGPELQEIATLIDQVEFLITNDFTAICLFEKLVFRTYYLQKLATDLLLICQSPLIQDFTLASKKLEDQVIKIVYYSGYTAKGLEEFKRLIADLRPICKDPYPTEALSPTLKEQLFSLRENLIKFITNELRKFPDSKDLFEEVGTILKMAPFDPPVVTTSAALPETSIEKQLKSIQISVANSFEVSDIHVQIGRLNFEIHKKVNTSYQAPLTRYVVYELNELHGITFLVNTLLKQLQLTKELRESPQFRQLHVLKAIDSTPEQLIPLHSLLKELVTPELPTPLRFLDRERHRLHRITVQAVSILCRNILMPDPADTRIVQKIFLKLPKSASSRQSYILRRIILNTYFQPQRDQPFDITLSVYSPVVEPDSPFPQIVQEYTTQSVLHTLSPSATTTLQEIYRSLSHLDPSLPREHKFFSDIYYFSKARQLLTHSEIQGHQLTGMAMERLRYFAEKLSLSKWMELATRTITPFPEYSLACELYPDLYRQLLSALWPDPQVDNMRETSIGYCDQILSHLIPFGRLQHLLQLLCCEYALMKFKNDITLTSNDKYYLGVHLDSYAKGMNKTDQFLRGIHGLLFMEETLYKLKDHDSENARQLWRQSRPIIDWETLMMKYSDFLGQPQSCRIQDLDEVRAKPYNEYEFFQKVPLVDQVIEFMEKNLKVKREEQ